MRKDLAKRFLLAAVSVLFACLLTETAFRVVGSVQDVDYRLYLKELKNSDRLPRGLFRADPGVGMVLAPDRQELAVTSDFSVVYRTNSKALRDREYGYGKSPGKLRVLALGDSFTFGEGVAYGERFTDIPEQQLDGIEILNAGVPGWGLESELLYLVREGRRYQPDWVVIFLNYVDMKREVPGLVREGRVVLPSEDAAPGREERCDTRQEGQTWYVRADDPLFQERNFLTRSSYALSYLVFRLTLAWRLKDLEQYDAQVWKGKGAGPQAMKATPIPTAPERTLLVLRKFVEIAKADGFRLMVVNISSWAMLDFVRDVDPDLAYHDLAPLLVAESQRRPLSFKYDRHYNPETHAVIGRALTEIFRRLAMDHSAGARGAAAVPAPPGGGRP